MCTVNSLVVDIMKAIVNEAATLHRYRKSSTMTALDIQSAIKLKMPGELAKHMVNEMARNVAAYEKKLAADKIEE